MSLPAGFGVNTGRAQKVGASSSKQPNKVSISQSVPKQTSPKKKDYEKRKPKDVILQASKKQKTLDTSAPFPYEAPVTPAGDWFGKIADGYIEPRHWDLWNKRNGEQAADACRRAAAELFFHLTCNPTDTEKLRASLDAASEDKKKLKLQLDTSEKDRARLEEFKAKAERDIPKLNGEADDLRIDLNKTAQDLSLSKERVAELEKQVEDLQAQLGAPNQSSFAEGFRSFVTGFLAVDPEYDWGKFVPATKSWIDEFRTEEAKAIEEKRMEIELEIAALSANQFLQQSSPEMITTEEARQDADGALNVNVTNSIPQLTQGEVPQEIPSIPSSQPGNVVSSQDQDQA